MLPFHVELRPGLPIADQVVFSVKKAVVSGHLREGASFPSVRVLSQELRINPNTAHRIAALLVSEGVLVTTPGIGSVVAGPGPADRREKAALLGGELEKLVVEARKLGLSLEDVQESLESHWKRLGGEPKDTEPRGVRE